MKSPEAAGAARLACNLTLGFSLGTLAMFGVYVGETSESSSLTDKASHFQFLDGADGNASGGNVSQDSSRMFYDPVVADQVFGTLPPGFKLSDVEYTHGELCSWGPNRSYVKHYVDFGAPGAREFIFAASKEPIVFLISLDHRLDRL